MRHVWLTSILSSPSVLHRTRASLACFIPSRIRASSHALPPACDRPLPARVTCEIHGPPVAHSSTPQGLKGGVWATSSGFTLSTEEQKGIVASFDNPAGAQANGIRAGGTKFFCLKADPRSVYGKQGVRIQPFSFMQLALGCQRIHERRDDGRMLC